MGMGVDATGNIYVGGFYDGLLEIGVTLDLGPYDFGNSFIAKLDNVASPIWARELGTDSDFAGDAFGAMATDRDGNVYVAGSFSFDIDFGGGPTTGDFSDGFFAVQNSDGGPLWNEIFSPRDDSRDVAVDADGNTFLVTALSEGNFGVVAAGRSYYLIRFSQ